MANALEQSEIHDLLKTLPGWQYEDDAIHCELSFANFREAMAFMVQVGFEAEEQAHHPHFENVFNTVKIHLNTHDAGNKVTVKDIALAKSINELAK